MTKHIPINKELIDENDIAPQMDIDIVLAKYESGQEAKELIFNQYEDLFIVKSSNTKDMIFLTIFGR